MLPVKIGGRQWLWLLLWTMLGASLRLTNLDGKPPWIDEFRTLVLSLGNSFQSIPLDRVINFQDLLAPLIPNPSATVSDILYRVSIEDRQPPIYFILVHLWLKLFPTDGGLVNLWGARALPAVLGILTIPCGYICSYFTFRWHNSTMPISSSPSVDVGNSPPLCADAACANRGSHSEETQSAQTIANFTAAILAVSPYGVFISQEARHYSLAILWVTISINCLAIACRYLAEGQKLPISLILVWVVVNTLGMGTHYFFSIALIAELMALGLILLGQVRQNKSQAGSKISIDIISPHWWRLVAVMMGTATGVSVWLWLLTSTYDRRIPAWIDNEPHKLIEVFNPLFQTIGASISMMSLLLVEVTEFPSMWIFSEIPIDINIPIVIFSAILMLIFFVWVIPLLKRGVWIKWQQLQTKIGTIAIVNFTVSAIGLYLAIPWLTGIDITRGARYHFVYFPGMMMLIGLGLASCWERKPSIAKWVSGKQAVTIVLLMGFVSSCIVANNYGYHKYYRSEQIVPMIQQSAPIPVLIATTHNSLIQVGEMMGLAWEIHHTDRENRIALPQFLFTSQLQKLCNVNCDASNILRETVARFYYPIDLWLINFYAPVSLPPTCDRDKKFMKGVYGYQYQLYHCQPIKAATF
jgi:uncharacterized membrane protein